MTNAASGGPFLPTSLGRQLITDLYQAVHLGITKWLNPSDIGIMLEIQRF